MLIMLTSAAAGSSATTQWLPSSHQSDFVAMADTYAQAVSSLREQAERATDSLMKNGFSIKQGCAVCAGGLLRSCRRNLAVDDSTPQFLFEVEFHRIPRYSKNL
jgi:hypothetical protein